MRNITTSRKLIASAALLLALGACNGGGSDDDDGEDFLRFLGDVFENAFDADLNDDPIDPQASDLTVSLTDEPFEI